MQGFSKAFIWQGVTGHEYGPTQKFKDKLKRVFSILPITHSPMPKTPSLSNFQRQCTPRKKKKGSTVFWQKGMNTLCSTVCRFWLASQRCLQLLTSWSHVYWKVYISPRGQLTSRGNISEEGSSVPQTGSQSVAVLSLSWVDGSSGSCATSFCAFRRGRKRDI